jgi:hypothetical protein
MMTITRIDTPLRSLGGSGSSTSSGAQLARAAQAFSKASSGLSHAEFVSDLGPKEAGQVAEWSEVQNDNRAWLQRVLDPRLEGNSTELTKTTRAVFGVLAKHGPQVINLDGFTRVNGMHLAMVLRATADELDNTNSWKKALGLARSALESSGVDPKIALYGLLPKGE